MSLKINQSHQNNTNIHIGDNNKDFFIKKVSFSNSRFI